MTVTSPELAPLPAETLPARDVLFTVDDVRSSAIEHVENGNITLLDRIGEPAPDDFVVPVFLKVAEGDVIDTQTSKRAETGMFLRDEEFSWADPTTQERADQATHTKLIDELTKANTPWYLRQDVVGKFIESNPGINEIISFTSDLGHTIDLLNFGHTAEDTGLRLSPEQIEDISNTFALLANKVGAVPFSRINGVVILPHNVLNESRSRTTYGVCDTAERVIMLSDRLFNDASEEIAKAYLPYKTHRTDISVASAILFHEAGHAIQGERVSTFARTVGWARSFMPAVVDNYGEQVEYPVLEKLYNPPEHQQVPYADAKTTIPTEQIVGDYDSSKVPHARPGYRGVNRDFEKTKAKGKPSGRYLTIGRIGPHTTYGLTSSQEDFAENIIPYVLDDPAEGTLDPVRNHGMDLTLAELNELSDTKPLHGPARIHVEHRPLRETKGKLQIKQSSARPVICVRVVATQEEALMKERAMAGVAIMARTVPKIVDDYGNEVSAYPTNW